MKAGVSILICTYNGARILTETLRHLALVRVRPEIPWEILVVDNASTDNTTTVVQEEWAKYGSSTPFSLLQQPKPGLTYARELGYAHAQYEYLVLCDDDNWLSPDYVNLAYDIMEAHPNIGALGGYGDLVYEVEPPSFATQLRLFANGHQAPQSGKVSRNIVYGASCVLRKRAYDDLFKMGFKPLLSDRVASSLSSGGDYELCYALALIGYDIWYDERLAFKHYMVKERQTWEYYLRYFKESSACFEVLDAYNSLVTYGNTTLFAFNLHFLKGILYYTHKIALLSLNKIKLDPASNVGKVNTLLLLGNKRRLCGYRKYLAVRKNFLQLLHFQEKHLKTK